MSKPAIVVSNLSKAYRIGTADRTYRTLRETLVDAAKAPFRRVRDLGRESSNGNDTFWALKNVSFEVQPGEVVGIIGRNGAGKSTLLKILSRITQPTGGRIVLRGGVASLLEVGTGFHPELTGRENIYLNGSILGMHRGEIDRNFDEIVAFAEISKFLDTPVKRYSSGMYVRLAFAVAAHLQPEILIVDEVLAVGDSEFQKKCMGKMGEVARRGRTVLFVSHSMTAVTRLCSRVILMDKGGLVEDGPAEKVAKQYLCSDQGTSAVREWKLEDAPGDEVVKLLGVRVRKSSGEAVEAVDIRQPIGIEMEYEVLKPDCVLVANYHFFNEEGINVFVLIDQDPKWRGRPRPLGRYVTTAWIPGNLLAEGTLVVGVAMTTLHPTQIHFYERDAVGFQVVDSDRGDSARGDYAGTMPGVVRPLVPWTTKHSGAIPQNGAVQLTGSEC